MQANNNVIICWLTTNVKFPLDSSDQKPIADKIRQSIDIRQLLDTIYRAGGQVTPTTLPEKKFFNENKPGRK